MYPASLHRSVRSVPGRRAAVAILVATLLVTASCSKSVSSSSDTTAPGSTTATTATTAAAATSTTVAATDEIDADALEAILPTAADIGSDFREVDDDEDEDDDGSFSAAIDESCPALGELVDDDEDGDEGGVGRDFEATDGRSFTVDLKPGVSESNVPDEAALREVVDAVNDCDRIEFSSDGIDFAVGLAMELDDAVGDGGVVYAMHVIAGPPEQPEAMEFSAYARMFVLDDIRVVVSAMGSVDRSTLETIPADEDLVESISGQLETDLADLLGR